MMADTTVNTNPKGMAGRWKIVFFLFGMALLQGLVVNLMPVMFNTIGETFHVDKARQGLLQSSFFAGSIVALIGSGYVTVSLGPRIMSILACMILGVGSIFFGMVNTYVSTLIAAGIMALGFGPFMSIYAAIIAKHFVDIRQRIYMWNYAVFAGSATIATTAMGALLDRLPNYKIIFIIFGIFIFLWLAVLQIVGGKQVDGRIQEKNILDHKSPLPKKWSGKFAEFWNFLTTGIFSKGAFYLMVILIICDYLAENNKIAWLPSFFQETYGGTNIKGGIALSASSIGVCTGRLLLGALPPGKISDLMLLAITYIINVLCFALVLILKPDYPAALGLVFLSGLCSSAQMPTMGAFTVAKFGDRAPIVVPMIECIGNFGGLIGPPLLGVIAIRCGELRAALWVIPAAGIILSATAFFWNLYDRKCTSTENIESHSYH